MTDVRAVPRAVRALGRQLAALERMVRDMAQADQADARAVTDGALDIYDDDGNLRGRVGKQSDGSFALKSFAPKPETPTEPDVIPVPGGCVVEWDGTFEEAQDEPVQRVAVHVGYSADFEVNTDEDEESDGDATEKAAILSPRGGSVFLALDPGDEKAWVRLTAIAEGGEESDPSPAVPVNIMSPEGAFWQDDVVLEDDGFTQIMLTHEPFPNSEHLYWNGLYQREDAVWTRIGRTVTLIPTGAAPKAGDSIVVEYAYLDDEEEIPLDGQAYRFVEQQQSYPYSRGVWAPGGALSMGALVQLRELPDAERVLFHQGSFPEWKNSFTLYVSAAGTLRLNIWTAPSVDEFFPTGEVTLGGGSLADLKAHQVMFTYRDRVGRVYVDGVQVITLRTNTTQANEIMHSHHAAELDVIFANVYTGDQAPPVDLDELLLFDRALRGDEVGVLARSWRTGRFVETAKELGPVKHCRLDVPPDLGYIESEIGGAFSWHSDPQPVVVDALQRSE